MKIQQQIPQGSYTSAGFIGKYQKLVSETVIPYQYAVLNDNAEGAEKSHVVQNFINAGKAIRGEDTGDGFYGMVFQDSRKVDRSRRLLSEKFPRPRPRKTGG